jgi:hypothetical protein
MMIESIKEGLALANKNLQLVIIRASVSIINVASLFIFLGFSVIVAITYLGFDLAQAKDLLPFLVRNPFEFVSRYLGIIILLCISLMFYLTFASLLYIYSLGGTLGVLKGSAVNIQYKFRFLSFFKEANTHFSRLLWLVSLVLLGVTAIFLVFLIMGLITVAVVQIITDSGSTFEIFFNSFALLTTVIFSITFILTGFIFTVYSLVILVTDGKGIKESIGGTYNFLRQHPQALLFYVILFIAIIGANTVYYGIQVSFAVIPVMAPFIYLFNAFFQSYLSIIVWSSLIAYYVKVSDYPVYLSNYEI